MNGVSLINNNSNFYSFSAIGNVNKSTCQNNGCVSFCATLGVRRIIPSGIKSFSISQAHQNAGVTGAIDIGLFARIIKYLSPQDKKTYAIKVPWGEYSKGQVFTDDIIRLKNESSILKKLRHIKEIPEFVYYKGAKTGDNAPSSNYMVIAWSRGKMPSFDSISYDFNMLNSKNIGSVYKTMSKLDDAGILHGDLWARNILFTKEKANIIDFDAASVFNRKTDYKKNNLYNFKSKFLHPYFSDVYSKLGESEYLKVYRDILRHEIRYNKNRYVHYTKTNNTKASTYYKDLNQNLYEQLKDPQKMKKVAICAIFDSNIYRADMYAKDVHKESREAILYYKRALELVSKHPDCADLSKAKLLRSNISVICKLENAKKLEGASRSLKVAEAFLLLQNGKIYTEQEKQKPYYEKITSYMSSLL